MPAPTRIYVVFIDHEKKLLVRAASPAQAIRHAARTYAARVADQDDLVQLLAAGAKVETAGDDEAAP